VDDGLLAIEKAFSHTNFGIILEPMAPFLGLKKFLMPVERRTNKTEDTLSLQT
jgi:hypothetical protein